MASFSLEERVEIYRLHAGGRSQNQIASALGRAPSTISRELRRNSRPTKVWAGGDCRLGGRDLTVEAVEHGKVAAQSIHTALSA